MVQEWLSWVVAQDLFEAASRGQSGLQNEALTRTGGSSKMASHALAEASVARHMVLTV